MLVVNNKHAKIINTIIFITALTTNFCSAATTCPLKTWNPKSSIALTLTDSDGQTSTTDSGKCIVNWQCKINNAPCTATKVNPDSSTEMINVGSGIQWGSISSCISGTGLSHAQCQSQSLN